MSGRGCSKRGIKQSGGFTEIAHLRPESAVVPNLRLARPPTSSQFRNRPRSTVATTTPNFIRGTVVPLIWLFKLLRDSIKGHYLPALGENAAYSKGMIYGALIVGSMTIVIACIALLPIDETFGRDLNFEEET